MAAVRRWLRAGGHRDVWLLVITAAVLIALEGFAPFGIQGLDDVANDAQHAAHDAQQAARDNAAARRGLARQIARQRISERDIKRIARGQARLERPTEADILRLIRRASEVCGRQPARCRAATPTRSQLGAESADRSPSPTTGRRRAPARRVPTRRRPRPPEGPQTPPSQRPEPRPPPSRPVVDVHTPPVGPLPPPVCAPPLIDINCP